MNDNAEEETSVDTILVSSPNSSATVTVNSIHDGPEATLVEQPAEQYVLETAEEKRGRRISHLVLYTTAFNIAIGFSIVLTGVWPYLRKLEPGVSKDMLGWVIAANPIGQMIASPLLGLWSNRAKSNRSAFITTITLFSLGNLLYALLSMFGTAALAVMIISRFLVGLSSANMTLIRSYISASTTVKERTTAVSLISAAQAIGYIIGPAIQTALAIAIPEDMSGTTNSTGVIVMEEEAQEAVVSSTGIQWNMYTATGWISCILGLINFVLFLPYIFQEYNIATKEAQYQKRVANDETSKFPKPDYAALFVILLTFFISVMIYVLLETLMVPMCMDLYAWNDQKTITLVGIALSIAAVICILTFILLSFITKVVDERKILIVGVLGMVASMIVFIPMGSTYPKMKNCTSIEPLTSHFNETLSIGDPFHLTQPSDTGIGILNSPTSTKDNAVLQQTFDNKSSEDLDSPLLVLRNKTREPIVLTTSENAVPTPMPPEIDSSSRVLRRQRRHVLHNGDCEDTGCPPAQEWCLHTPIIELPQLMIASLIAVIGYPVVFTISSAMYSKILGPKPQGLWMGLLMSIGSLSRATGPITVSYIYTELGTRWTFSILTSVMFFNFVIIVVMYKRMVPMNIFKKR